MVGTGATQDLQGQGAGWAGGHPAAVFVCHTDN